MTLSSRPNNTVINTGNISSMDLADAAVADLKAFFSKEVVARSQSKTDLTNTDLYRELTAKRVELSSRVRTLQANTFDLSIPAQKSAAVRNQEWIAVYQKELAALSKAIWVLGDDL